MTLELRATALHHPPKAMATRLIHDMPLQTLPTGIRPQVNSLLATCHLCTLNLILELLATALQTSTVLVVNQDLTLRNLNTPRIMTLTTIVDRPLLGIPTLRKDPTHQSTLKLRAMRQLHKQPLDNELLLLASIAARERFAAVDIRVLPVENVKIAPV
jgi:hypothetical protein